MPLWLRCSALIATVLVLTPRGGLAQADIFELQLKLERGEVLYYSATIFSQRRVETVSPPGIQIIGPARQTTTSQASARVAIRVLDMDQAGTKLVERVLEDFRVSVDGQTKEVVGGPWVFRVQPNGKVVETQTEVGMEDIPIPRVEDFPIVLPGRPVKIGDSWSRQFGLRIADILVPVVAASSLVAVDRSGGELAARIRTRLEGAVGNSRSPIQGLVLGVEEVVWSLDRGRPLRSRIELTGESRRVVVVTSTGTGSIAIAEKSTTTHEELSPEKVVLPPVPQALQIAPGKSIGGISLNLSLANIESQLGSSRSGAPDETMWGADRGFRTAEMTWPNGLVAYVDYGDRTRLVGLGVTDRRYRTSKGLGPGSSEGAVLMAHGMSPTRIEMSGRPLSQLPVRVLIYNDQGIAFGITGGKKLTSATAPSGAVRWIVVFSPGGASGIFPVP